MYEYIDVNKLFDNKSTYGKKFKFGPVTDEMIKKVEEKLGYKLPNSYIELLKIQNGGLINGDLYEDYAEVECIYGISEDENSFYGLLSMYDNWIEEWEYPRIGIPIAETESAGHEIYFMDYRNVGEDGEPKIILIDQENDYSENFVAENFEEFVRKIYNRKD